MSKIGFSLGNFQRSGYPTIAMTSKLTILAENLLNLKRICHKWTLIYLIACLQIFYDLTYIIYEFNFAYRYAIINN
jgi:hypothetical protein